MLNMPPQIEWYNYAVAFFLLFAISFVGRGGSKPETEEEYLIGSREITDWRLAATIASGIVGGGVILVFPEYAFKYGLSALWIVAGIFAGTLCTLFVARAFKPLADRQKFYSLPDFYLFNWGRRAGFLATLAVVLWTLGFIVLQLICSGLLLRQMTGLPYWAGVAIAAATVASYLITSGFRAVVLTDLFQYGALLLLLFILFPIALVKVDLFSAYRVALKQSLDWGDAIGFFLLGGLNVVVGADLWQRIYAAKSPSHARRGIQYAAVSILFAGLLLMIPSISINLLPSAGHIQSEYGAFAESLKLLLPHWLFGFGLVGALATVIATLDTMVFILAVSISHDIKVRQLNSPSSDRVRTIRFAILIALILGAAISIMLPNLLQTGIALSTVGLVLAPSIILAMTPWKPSAYAVETSLTVGLITASALLFTGRLTPESTLLAFVASILGIIAPNMILFVRRE
jgi:Na+/proline symporter